VLSRATRAQAVAAADAELQRDAYVASTRPGPATVFVSQARQRKHSHASLATRLLTRPQAQPPDTLLCPICADVLRGAPAFVTTAALRRCTKADASRLIAEPLLFAGCHHAFCADCLATPTGRGTGRCPMPACAPRGPAVPDKSVPDAESDAMRAQRVAALRIFCQARPSRAACAAPCAEAGRRGAQFAVVPTAEGEGWAFDAAGCRAQVALGRREAHEASAFRVTSAHERQRGMSKRIHPLPGCSLARVRCGLRDDTDAAAPSACPAVVRSSAADAHRRTCPFRMVRIWLHVFCLLI
jgi:hypothetical protein